LASLAYTSQVPVFWDGEEALLDEIRKIIGIFGGLALWNPVEDD
jgi:hypothetical protein